MLIQDTELLLQLVKLLEGCIKSAAEMGCIVTALVCPNQIVQSTREALAGGVNVSKVDDAEGMQHGQNLGTFLILGVSALHSDLIVGGINGAVTLGTQCFEDEADILSVLAADGAGGNDEETVGVSGVELLLILIQLGDRQDAVVDILQTEDVVGGS